jgi:hypothetical protein
MHGVRDCLVIMLLVVCGFVAYLAFSFSSPSFLEWFDSYLKDRWTEKVMFWKSSLEIEKKNINYCYMYAK